MWHHCMNLVRSEADRKHMSIRMNYQSENIIVFVVIKKVATRTALVRSIGIEALSTYILPYSWYKCDTGKFEHLQRSKDGVASITEHKTFLLSIRTIRSDAATFETAVGHWKEIDHALHYLSYTFLREHDKLKPNNKQYRLQVAEVRNFSPLHALSKEHGHVLSLRFSEFEEEVMKTLNI